ncbi:TetR/AcrR family transcriptional regulator [Microvenator marinus]|jgi:TetR/AcrR family fatty acid metabolism transcriptional regulator|uniref:TetR/AcrR family transcriptional regulator n=1 Tax=Microvenator marinus TaxID=2600177 RepID=A0A5B8XW99_9DELT|nr:TetR/AcrR family transcriptional regulator [Microvenator marinus]QED29218.1 TetR/AcrR family transcriptional regulator [Microvenator marinus]
MAQVEKVQKSQNDKRQRILEGALKAFARKGFYNTKVSEIASEAGVADGTIYLYFKNKDDLLISLFEDRMEWVIERLETELADSPGDVFEKLRQVVDMHFKLALEEPDLAEFITVELRQSAKFMKEYKNPRFLDYLRILERIVEVGQEQGVIRKDIDPRLFGRALFGALDEVLLTLTFSKNHQVEEKTRQVADLFIEGLRAR